MSKPVTFQNHCKLLLITFLALTFFSTSIYAQIPSAGLVAYYPFNGNALDKSGNANNGSVTNASLTTDRFGNPNQAYSFSGNNSYINCGSDTSLQITGDISLCAWFYLDGGSLNPRLLSYESPEGNYRITTSGTSNGSRLLNCSYGNITLSAEVSALTWHHVILSYGNGEARLFIDGIKIKDSIINQVETLNYTTSLNIGRKAAAAYDDWGGKIDEVLIYNRALSDDESIQIYNTTTYLPVGDLILYLPFNGNADDLSGYNDNGIVSGATLTTDRFGIPDKAYDFNHTYITIPNKDYLNLTKSLTISSWFYLKEYTFLPYNGSFIICKHDGDKGADGFIYGILDPNHNTSEQILDFEGNPNWNTSTYPGDSGIIVTNKWYHFVVTYDDTLQVLKYYLNGNIVFQRTLPFNILPNNLDLTIGYSLSSLGVYLDYFKGTIDDIRIYSKALGDSDISLLYHEGGYGSGVLAEEGIKLNGHQKNTGIELNWSTISEANASSYTVERSFDGIVYAPVTVIPVNKAYKGSYSYIDGSVALTDHSKVYYRIKQNKPDGPGLFSPSIRVNYKGSKNSIIVYPNPVKNTLNLLYKLSDKQEVVLIYTQSGTLVRSVTLPANSATMSVDVSNLTQGVYLIKLINSQNNIGGRFMKE